MPVTYYTEKYKELAKKQLRYEHEFVGKTIAYMNVYSGSYQILMVFTDGTFAAIDGQGEYDGGADVYVESEPIDIRKVDNYFQRAKLITDQELRAEMDEQNKVKFAEEDAEERKEFERLAAKFGPKDGQP